MNAGFTPGPWHVYGWHGTITGAKTHSGDHVAVWADKGATLICPCGPATDDESTANAYLIAAAPAMLAELIRLVDICDREALVTIGDDSSNPDTLRAHRLIDSVMGETAETDA